MRVYVFEHEGIHMCIVCVRECMLALPYACTHMWGVLKVGVYSNKWCIWVCMVCVWCVYGVFMVRACASVFVCSWVLEHPRAQSPVHTHYIPRRRCAGFRIRSLAPVSRYRQQRATIYRLPCIVMCTYGCVDVRVCIWLCVGEGGEREGGKHRGCPPPRVPVRIYNSIHPLNELQIY